MLKRISLLILFLTTFLAFAAVPVLAADIQFGSETHGVIDQSLGIIAPSLDASIVSAVQTAFPNKDIYIKNPDKYTSLTPIYYEKDIKYLECYD